MIDDVDQQIIQLLQDNARLSNSAIAKEVGLTISTVHDRVKKLEKKGIIKGYVAIIDANLIDKPLTSFIRLMLGPSASYSEAKKTIIELFKNEADILEAHGIAGEDCYLIKVKSANTKALENLIERIREKVQLVRSVTNIVLSTIKETSKIVP